MINENPSDDFRKLQPNQDAMKRKVGDKNRGLKQKTSYAKYFLIRFERLLRHFDFSIYTLYIYQSSIKSTLLLVVI